MNEQDFDNYIEYVCAGLGITFAAIIVILIEYGVIK